MKNPRPPSKPLNQPLFNIIMRTSGRPRYFARAVKSVLAQTYANWRLIVSYDNEAAPAYIKPFKDNAAAKMTTLRVYKSTDPNLTAPYNLYLNDLMDACRRGWYVFLDDDDTLANPSTLMELSRQVNDGDPGTLYIGRWFHRGIVRPQKKNFGDIRKGQCGTSAQIFHAKWRALRFGGMRPSDYEHAIAMSRLLPRTKYIKTIIIKTDNNGSEGRMDDLGHGPFITEKYDSPLDLRCCAFIMCIKDDLSLASIIRRVKGEGVLDVRVYTPDRYFNGQPTPEADIKNIQRVCEDENAFHRTLSVPENVRGKSYLEQETVVRNIAFDRLSSIYDWIMVVDADELWRPGAGVRLAQTIKQLSPGITQVACKAIPYMGAPAYPAAEAFDKYLIATRRDEPFFSMRSCRKDKNFKIEEYLFHHFTVIRRTRAEIIEKLRGSSHYDDPRYRFEWWIKEVLPNIRPGFAGTELGTHMYDGHKVWGSIRACDPGELMEIPADIASYLGDAAAKPEWHPKTISLIAPSRWRPDKCINNLLEWLDLAESLDGIEVILSIDDDDETEPQYLENFQKVLSRVSGKLFVGKNNGDVSARNRAAKHCAGDIIVSVFDDFTPPKHWDKHLHQRLYGQPGKVLFVYDGTISMANRCLQTIHIHTRKSYEDWGYIVYPEYEGMYSDNDFTEKAMLEGRAVYALDLKFEHKHYTTGQNPMDRTYRHGNDPAKYERGKKIFERRRAENFSK